MRILQGTFRSHINGLVHKDNKSNFTTPDFEDGFSAFSEYYE